MSGCCAGGRGSLICAATAVIDAAILGLVLFIATPEGPHIQPLGNWDP